jgi:hypothetical protein
MEYIRAVVTAEGYAITGGPQAGIRLRNQIPHSNTIPHSLVECELSRIFARR